MNAFLSLEGVGRNLLPQNIKFDKLLIFRIDHPASNLALVQAISNTMLEINLFVEYRNISI